MHGTIGQRFYHLDKLDDDEADELLLRAADKQEPRTPILMQLASAITTKLEPYPLLLSTQVMPSRRTTNKARHDDDDAEYIKNYSAAVQLLKLFSFLHYEHISFEFLTGAVKHPSIQREFDTQASERLKEEEEKLVNFAWQPSLWLKHLQRTINIFKMKQLKIQNPVILPTFLLDAELSTSSYDFNVQTRELLYLLVQLS
ncbi:MAG: hypothetical protein Q9192_008068 [Flavoplaca navasiana]